MSNLQRTIAQRRESAPSGLTSGSPQSGGKTLLVHIWRGESWALPWVHFCSARLDDGAEQLDLVFSRYLVIVTGRNLRGLFEELAAFRVSSLGEMPEDCRPIEDDDAPFISQIAVGGSPELPPGRGE